MRSGDFLVLPSASRPAVFRAGLLVLALTCSLTIAALPARTLVVHQQQRYSMGTMFSVTVFHGDPTTAQRGIERALSEIVRLDQVMSHYKPESDLSRLNREARHAPVVVERSLYEVIDESLMFSRWSSGRFDITIAPLLRAWREAQADGRSPSADEITQIGRCLGYQNIEVIPPDRIRFRSDCLELDLGGIGKGYAVDRALGVLRSEGIRHASVNAGGSTIGAIGAPPDERGWPIQLGARIDGSDSLILRDSSISTSQQTFVSPAVEDGGVGEIMDPGRRAPTRERAAVSVIARTATAADALSTALLLMPVAEARALLEEMPGVSALWISPDGGLQAAHRASALQLAHSK